NNRVPTELSTYSQCLLLLLLSFYNLLIYKESGIVKININRQYFIEQLNNCLKAISPRTTLPILNGIKIDVKDDRMILTGSDSEISIEITIPVEVDNEEVLEIHEAGAVVLSGRFFVDIIKKLSGE